MRTFKIELSESQLVDICAGLEVLSARYRSSGQAGDRHIADGLDAFSKELQLRFAAKTTEELMAECRRRTGTAVAAEHIREFEAVRRLPCGMIASAVRYGEQDCD